MGTLDAGFRTCDAYRVRPSTGPPYRSSWLADSRARTIYSSFVGGSKVADAGSGVLLAEDPESHRRGRFVEISTIRNPRCSRDSAVSVACSSRREGAGRNGSRKQ
jgi:hypothetical protein